MNFLEDLFYPLRLLENKRVLLLVSGSIAAYKSLELTRLLFKSGASIQVVMSESAKKFIKPLSFEALSHHKVLHDRNEKWYYNHQNKLHHNHIACAANADLLIFAPLSANSLSKIAHALADNTISATFLACTSPKILAPSMNTNMLNSPIIQSNLKRLKDSNHIILDTKNALLACDTKGDGAMAEPLEILFKATQTFLKDAYFENREVIIMGGASIEKIDSVRVISNLSSGIQASALALALYFKGAKVTLIASSFPTPLPKEIASVSVSDTASYENALNNAANNLQKHALKPLLFNLAAISDYLPKTSFNHKLKKSELGETLNVECVQNKDLLASVNPNQFVKIGFKAEDDQQNAIKNAQNLLKPFQDNGKDCSVAALNLIKDSRPFGSLENELWLFSHKKTQKIPSMNKLEASFKILDFIKDNAL
ncbi:bifunctional phosphopantothenoylcysteine decarboxylase/phosphopantothenate--cysteine ligase CoaBC [Helicobacter pylori]|uniref:bifunctional phosphopantothenoylcysteine decarboxylase/phosphopantothenate--cysteine ligase CoaBC n=1 Tax=Helicobacter pylori TaxID=210 RepID=UPI001237B6C0|nr:bifunctional phosphopantothenoylcysteine decarboxylase/phosphopantothenate--cysteine ligase CoaBC [Helicobacter pylori]KAA6499857.1 bifunctional phosphopantothenoylcysteine decarboxylase/phosphopantothenate--cysteine ligase CoaBC [Helicobacter pylori]KAA6504005.1 bifunctional phosphopantothenoylcysteine decarboxylase/phosphopantothenate--cysteine ligase CoaBC [Helicobacter pylori]KAA6516865.1 bifunctional phosphopantothenoylcysteine decarboxylase/phosphopantothenate--cysteine ligase CoaBC [He